MNIVAQMTPYGVYGIKYLKKNTEVTSKAPISSTRAVKVYNSNAAPFFLSQNNFSANLSSSQKQYKQDIFAVMSSARTLSESAERFTKETWPKAKAVTGYGLGAEILLETDYQEISVDVKQLAQTHSFRTDALEANKNSTFAQGTYSLFIEQNGHKQKVAFSLSEKDNMRNVAYKLSDAINSFSKQVYAETHEDNGYITVSVNAAESGAGGEFSLSDDVGNVLAKLGLRLNQKGQDAIVNINGKEHRNKNNTLIFDNKIKLTPSAVGSFPVRIEPDNEQAAYSLSALVNNFNNFKEIFSSSENTTTKAKEMFGTFADLFAGNENNDKMGIGLRADGFLDFDEAGLLNSLKENPQLIKEAMSGNRDISNLLYNMGESIMRNPLSLYFASFSGGVNTDPAKFSGIVVDILT